MIGRFVPLAGAMALVLSGCDLESASSSRQGASLTLDAFARTTAELPSASRIEIVFSSDSGTRTIDTIHSRGTALALGRVAYGERFSLSVLGYDTSSRQKIVRWYGSAAGSANGLAVQQVDVALDSVPYGAPLTDPRDARTYRTTKIGTQTWMAENLDYKGTGTVAFGRCYGDSAVSCARYGRLYTWAEALGLDTAYNRKAWGKTTSRLQGICPTGWHVPDDTEWNAMFAAVGGSDSAGFELKANSALWKTGAGVADAHGFSVLPGSDGVSRSSTVYDDADIAVFLSATETDDSSLAGFTVSAGSTETTRFAGRKSMDLSVRCVKNP